MARPEVVVHQLTDLPQVLDPARLCDALTRNARLRIEGTPNLVAAAEAAGVGRLIAQSIAFAYAYGPEPHAEGDALASADGNEPSAVTPSIEGIVLRRLRMDIHPDGQPTERSQLVPPAAGAEHRTRDLQEVAAPRSNRQSEPRIKAESPCKLFQSRPHHRSSAML